MTDAELQILRDAAIGPDRGPRAGEHVELRVTGAARACEPGPRWERVPLDELPQKIYGWIDNLDEDGGTVMVYGRRCTYALRFWEIQAVRWREVAHV